MQTFLPYADFSQCAKVLDSKRIGNQVYRECKTIINGGWKNHPASLMWRGFKPALALYATCLLQELTRRGRHYPHHYEFFEKFMDIKHIAMPPWLGDERLHSSHRAALLRKDYIWYYKFGWKDDTNIPYFWPVKKEMQ